LNAVMGWAEVLQRTAPGSADFERGVTAISRNARLQAQLIEDLLDTSRIVSGTLDLELSTVELSEVVDAAIESLQPAMTARRIRIARNCAGAVRVQGDRRRLQQVVWNLLSNAVKFSPSGGTVQVALTGSGRDCVLEVRDQGQGIDPAFLPFLFERFRQQDSSRTRLSGGLGLGLSIVKQIVQLHSGTVIGTSDGPDTGATFRVALPCASEEHADSAAEPVARSGGSFEVLRSARILVVDDEPDARELVARILRNRDAEVLLAASAEEALATVLHERPDLIVSDIGMPVKDGFDFIGEVRGLASDERATPAIALTAFARVEDQEMALRAGFQRHLGKPVDSAVLLAACAELLVREPSEQPERAPGRPPPPAPSEGRRGNAGA
jgi:CheY-like chemotaxis protein/anti-sigma regulatory factor (Ser/Thr protein kinase)